MNVFRNDYIVCYGNLSRSYSRVCSVTHEIDRTVIASADVINRQSESFMVSVCEYASIYCDGNMEDE